MKERKSMRGIPVDLGKLMAQSDKIITVGNTKSNARGDQLGRAGRVVKSASDLARDHYNANNPNAVKTTSLKVDTPDMNTKLEDAKATAAASPLVDDWEEPQAVPEKVQEASTPVQEDEWVEDAEGNFVKKSELDAQTSKKSKSKK